LFSLVDVLNFINNIKSVIKSLLLAQYIFGFLIDIKLYRNIKRT